MVSRCAPMLDAWPIRNSEGRDGGARTRGAWPAQDAPRRGPTTMRGARGTGALVIARRYRCTPRPTEAGRDEAKRGRHCRVPSTPTCFGAVLSRTRREERTPKTESAPDKVPKPEIRRQTAIPIP